MRSFTTKSFFLHRIGVLNVSFGDLLLLSPLDGINLASPQLLHLDGRQTLCPVLYVVETGEKIRKEHLDLLRSKSAPSRRKAQDIMFGGHQGGVVGGKLGLSHQEVKVAEDLQNLRLKHRSDVKKRT
jgi:hypothetical protein